MKRFGYLLLAAGCAIAAYRCADPGAIGPEAAKTEATPWKGLTISDSHKFFSESVFPAGVALAGGTQNQELIFVALAPGTLPDAVEAEIENRTWSRPGLVVPTVDGGFDPVAVPGKDGDTLTITARMSDGRIQPMMVKVPAKRPPSVVRTNPSKGRTDVALTVIIGVVFSEPINRSTANTSSIQLLRGGKQVSGEVFLQDNAWNAEFVPSEVLEPGTAYELVVTRQVRDLEGEALDSAYSIPFVTDSAQCGIGDGQTNCPTGIETSRGVKGTVTERTANGTRPVPNVAISVWVQPNSGTGYSLGDVRSDVDGNYAVSSLPAGTVQLFAKVEGLDQPCAAVTSPTLPAAQADIELVATGSQATQLTRGSSLWGFVYDAEWGATFPVPDVRVVIESHEGIVAATATSDINGNFNLCRLPNFAQQTIAFARPGYNTVKAPFVLGPGAYSLYAPLQRVIPNP